MRFRAMWWLAIGMLGAAACTTGSEPVADETTTTAPVENFDEPKVLVTENVAYVVTNDLAPTDPEEAVQYVREVLATVEAQGGAGDVRAVAIVTADGYTVAARSQTSGPPTPVSEATPIPVYLIPAFQETLAGSGWSVSVAFGSGFDPQASQSVTLLEWYMGGPKFWIAEAVRNLEMSVAQAGITYNPIITSYGFPHVDGFVSPNAYPGNFDVLTLDVQFEDGSTARVRSGVRVPREDSSGVFTRAQGEDLSTVSSLRECLHEATDTQIDQCLVDAGILDDDLTWDGGGDLNWPYVATPRPKVYIMKTDEGIFVPTEIPLPTQSYDIAQVIVTVLEDIPVPVTFDVGDGPITSAPNTTPPDGDTIQPNTPVFVLAPNGIAVGETDEGTFGLDGQLDCINQALANLGVPEEDFVADWFSGEVEQALLDNGLDPSQAQNIIAVCGHGVVVPDEIDDGWPVGVSQPDLWYDGIHECMLDAAKTDNPTSMAECMVREGVLTPSLEPDDGDLRFDDPSGLFRFPIADLNGPTTALCDEPTWFDGSGSRHTWPTAQIATYEFDFDYDGSTFNVDASVLGPIGNPADAVVATSYSTPGTYTVALRVTDDDTPQQTDMDTHTLVVACDGDPVADDASTTTTTASSSGATTLGDGFYQVGTDITPGTWIPNGDDCTWVLVHSKDDETEGSGPVTVPSGIEGVGFKGGCQWRPADG